MGIIKLFVVNYPSKFRHIFANKFESWLCYIQKEVIWENKTKKGWVRVSEKRGSTPGVNVTRAKA